MRTFGLIPAAGKSSRMGRPKLLLTLAGQTVLERVVTSVRLGGVAEALVVVAPEDLALREIAERAGAHVLQLQEDTPHMLQTSQRGLEWIAERFRPRSDDGWLLIPADHPSCRPEVVRALLAAALVHCDCSIVVPVHQRMRGHPVWLRWELAAAIQALPAERGLNAFVRDHADRTVELPWDSTEILRDLDTPQDYRKLLRDADEAGSE
jgi:molybdenum cofactor cytidylyltransferase